MLKGNFNIGPDKDRTTKGITSYTNDISTNTKKDYNREFKDNRMHLQGSINFGNHSNEF